MTVSTHTESSTTSATAAEHGIPLELVSMAVLVVCLVVALVILASYRLYDGPGFRELLEGRTRRRARNPDR
jgi:hypothetical protein